MTIDAFVGEAEFLSNFYMHPVGYCGTVYPSNEHAYQAAKSLDDSVRQRIAKLKTPGQAKKAGRALKLRPDWEKKKLDIMGLLIRRKFLDPDLAARLCGTGRETLIEGNWWGDTFWGVCKGVGENHLGKLLMQERELICETLR